MAERKSDDTNEQAGSGGLDREQQQHAAQEKGTAHHFTSEEARKADHKDRKRPTKAD